MAERRQITDEEKMGVLSQHQNRCFIDGAPFSEDEIVEFHHIKPFSEDGPTHIDNIAPICKVHHRRIGKMSLQEFKDKIELEDFFSDNMPKYLDNVITKKHGHCGEKIKYEMNNGTIDLYFHDKKLIFQLYPCPTSGWKYFYAKLPINYIGNDKELQPRALRVDSMWSLYRHFQNNTQLSPSICRMDEDGTILLFDGQHKAAAQIWNGRDMIECKVYMQADKRELKETNLEAHSSFRQMSFYSHELLSKYADIFGEDWNEYMQTKGEKSELGFCNFLINSRGKTHAKAKNEIASAMYNEILEDKNNSVANYLSEKHRGRKQPLTFARVKKTFFQHMLVSPPVKDEFESDADFRGNEKKNLIKLINIIVEKALDNKWNPERNDAAHKKAERIFGAGAIRAWVVLLKDAINTHIKHYDDDSRKRFFYRNINEGDFEHIEAFVDKLFSHKLWDDPDPTGEITARLFRDDLETSKALFEEKGLTAQWLLGM